MYKVIKKNVLLTWVFDICFIFFKTEIDAIVSTSILTISVGHLGKLISKLQKIFALCNYFFPIFYIDFIFLLQYNSYNINFNVVNMRSN